MKKLKKDNKGFSLVELIVVMAIMAILAVTLTPRLTQYIDKARQTNDRELPNAVFTVVRLGLLDDNIKQDIVNSATSPNGYNWTTGVDVLDEFYGGATDQFTALEDGGTPPLPTLDLLASEIMQTLGDDFRFQSKLADTDRPKLTVTIPAGTINDGQFTVVFSYGDLVAGSYTMDTSKIGD